jgi:hypothetical protein
MCDTSFKTESARSTQNGGSTYKFRSAAVLVDSNCSDQPAQAMKQPQGRGGPQGRGASAGDEAAETQQPIGRSRRAMSQVSSRDE